MRRERQRHVRVRCELLQAADMLSGGIELEEKKVDREEKSAGIELEGNL